MVGLRNAEREKNLKGPLNMIKISKKYFYILYLVLAIFYVITFGLAILFPKESDLNFFIFGSVFILSLIVLILDRKRWSHLFKSIDLKKNAPVILSIFLVLCITGLINHISYKWPIQWDVSKNELTSLTKESLEVLSNIKDKLQIKIFAKEDQLLIIRPLLELYRIQNTNLEIEMVNLDKSPEISKQYALESDPALFFQYHSRTHLVYEISELSITNSLIALLRDRDPIVWYSTGLGEESLVSEAPTGFSQLALYLQKAQIKLVEKDLKKESEIPDEVGALILWGPKQSLDLSGLSLIENYLDRGGKLLLGLDVQFNKDLNEPFQKLLNKRGLFYSHSLVLDNTSFVNGSDGQVPIAQINQELTTLKLFKGDLFFPLSLHFSYLAEFVENKKIEKIKIHEIVKTSDFPHSYAVVPPSRLVDKKLDFLESVDEKGPLTLVLAWEHLDDPKSKIVLFGNSSFLSNQYTTHHQSIKFFSALLNWALEGDFIQSFNLPTGNDRPVFLNTIQFGLIFYLLVVVLPLFFLIFAFVLYRKRRGSSHK